MTKDFGDKNDEKSDSYSHINQGFSSFLAQKPKSDCLNSSLSVLDENWYNIFIKNRFNFNP
jgi:hypothetical protein